MFEAFFGLLAVGTIWFWLVVLGFFTTMAFYSESDGVNATITFIFGAIFLQFVAGLNVFHLIAAQVEFLPMWAFWYLFIGIVFATIKWTVYVDKQRKIYNELRKDFIVDRLHLKRDDAVIFTTEQKGGFENYLADYYKPNRNGTWDRYSKNRSVIPDIHQNKITLIRWMMWWPVNAVYTFFNDPVRIFFDWAYDTMNGALQAVANKAFAGTEKDRLTDEERAQINSGTYRANSAK